MGSRFDQQMATLASRPLAQLCRVVEITLLALILGGCVILPMPFGAPDPLYSSAQIKSIQKDVSTKETILLGGPTLQRDAERMLIYVWEVKHGDWLVIPYEGIGNPSHLGALYSETRVLVLEFDSQEVLRNKEFAHHVMGSDDRYCTEGGVCIEHTIAIGDSGSRRLIHEFRNDYSAVTVKGKEREQITRLVEPQATECLLVMWPDKDWTQSASGPAPGGLALKVEGVSGTVTWIPAEAFAVITLPAG